MNDYPNEMIHEPIIPPRTPSEKEYEVVLARSDLLDSFSDLEAQITNVIKAAKAETKCQHFGARLEVFRKTQGINHAKRDQIADRIAELLPLRADVVHSRMRIHNINGTATGVFVNSQNQGEAYPLGRMLSADDLTHFNSWLKHLADEVSKLNKAINPPSSQQPPSPGAKVDP